MTDSALLVVNERARGARGRAALADAVRVLERAYRVRVAVPRSPADLATTVAAAEEPLVIAAGGDGTLNAVVAAMPDGATLGILPVGTANDFARELGVPRQLVAAAHRLTGQKGHPAHAVDLLRVNGLPFCTVGGVGLVTRTTLAVLRMKEGHGAARRGAQLLGSLVYRLAATAAIVAGRDLVDALHLRFRRPGGEWVERDVRAHALFVVNHRMCGGGLSLPTGSDGADGVLELGIVHAGSRVALAANFSRLAAGAPVPASAFEVVPATEAVITAAGPLPFAADGELLDTAAVLSVTMHPRALRIAGAAPRA